MKKHVIAVAILLTLVACKTTEESLKEAGNKPLTSDQIEQTLIGTTLAGISGRTGNSFEAVFEKNGTAKVLVGNGREDSGTWKITKNNTLCTKYTWIRNGEENCRRYYKVGNEYQSVQLDGSASSKFKIVKGTPKKL